MSKIKIVVDTASDLTEEQIKEYGFGVVRFMSIFGEKSYITGLDMTNKEFYEKLEKAKKIPTTSQTPYMTMYETLLNEAKENDTVIYFTISSKASGQNHSAQMVAQEIKEEYPEADIRIVDTLNFSVFIAYAAIKAKEMIDEGEEDVNKIIEKSLSDMNCWKAYFLVDDMMYLEKGGRINKTTAVFGSLLDIKPVLTIKDGLVAFEDKLRGKKKIVDKMISKMEEDPEFDFDAKRFLIAHSNDEAAEELKEKLEESYGEGAVEIFSEVGPIVGTHTGKGVIGLLFRKNG